MTLLTQCLPSSEWAVFVVRPAISWVHHPHVGCVLHTNLFVCHDAVSASASAQIHNGFGSGFRSQF